MWHHKCIDGGIHQSSRLYLSWWRYLSPWSSSSARSNSSTWSCAPRFACRAWMATWMSDLARHEHHTGRPWTRSGCWDYNTQWGIDACQNSLLWCRLPTLHKCRLPSTSELAVWGDPHWCSDPNLGHPSICSQIFQISSFINIYIYIVQ